MLLYVDCRCAEFIPDVSSDCNKTIRMPALRNETSGALRMQVPRRVVAFSPSTNVEYHRRLLSLNA
jgi:hypothetical protein